MMKTKFPEYNHSIVNLTNSILKYYGVENPHDTLPEADEALAKQEYKNVVLMVFDAMGTYNLERILAQESFFRKHQKATISSVFPPTTVAATTSLDSGLYPSEHSWLGWSLHFHEINDNVNVFINTNDRGESVADYFVAGKYIPYQSVIEKINATGKIKADSVSRFGTCYAETLDDIVDETTRLCGESGKHYLYTYLNEPDSTMHKQGIDSMAVVDWIIKIEQAVRKLSSQVEDTLILVTADHGHIDNRTCVAIQDYPELLSTLKWLPSIEPRALSLFVKEGEEERFKTEFLKHFHRDFILLSKEEVLEAKLFGDGAEHPHFQEFLGDYLAIGTGDVSIFNSREEAQEFIGIHAGLTQAEMEVPLIIIDEGR